MAAPSLDLLEQDALAKLEKVGSAVELAQLRSEVLGKKGALGQALRALSGLPVDERKAAGQRINEHKQRLQEAFAARAAALEQAAQAAALAAEAFDMTAPGRRPNIGSMHPLRQVEWLVIESLRDLGFRVVEGRWIEHDWFNFEALNFPPDHPSRDAQDTFFINDEVVLRTQTSNMQIRTLLAEEPPVRILSPGMVFRKDEVDATHSPVFHQIEGLWIDEKAHFGDLKGVLHRLLAALFGPDIKTRYRPSFFPFTEPSLEVDVARPERPGAWIEVLGAGVVDPAVLENVGLDPERYQGFAFGLGIERMAMLRFGIDDIRLLYQNDRRLLRQFSPEGAA